MRRHPFGQPGSRNQHAWAPNQEEENEKSQSEKVEADHRKSQPEEPSRRLGPDRRVSGCRDQLRQAVGQEVARIVEDRLEARRRARREGFPQGGQRVLHVVGDPRERAEQTSAHEEENCRAPPHEVRPLQEQPQCRRPGAAQGLDRAPPSQPHGHSQREERPGLAFRPDGPGRQVERRRAKQENLRIAVRHVDPEAQGRRRDGHEEEGDDGSSAVEELPHEEIPDHQEQRSHDHRSRRQGFAGDSEEREEHRGQMTAERAEPSVGKEDGAFRPAGCGRRQRAFRAQSPSAGYLWAGNATAARRVRPTRKRATTAQPQRSKRRAKSVR